MDVPYSPEEIARVIELVGQGLSASQIAEQMEGRTRNSIISLVHRRLSKEGVAFARPAPKNVEAGKRRKRYYASNRQVAPRSPASNKRAVIAETPAVETGEFFGPGLSLMMLGTRHCRWPINDPERGGTFLFCAQPVENRHDRPGGLYCGCHRLRMKGIKPTAAERASAMNGFEKAARVMRKWAA